MIKRKRGNGKIRELEHTGQSRINRNLDRINRQFNNNRARFAIHDISQPSAMHTDDNKRSGEDGNLLIYVCLRVSEELESIRLGNNTLDVSFRSINTIKFLGSVR